MTIKELLQSIGIDKPIKNVSGTFSILGNKEITSLEGAPQKCKEFFCGYCDSLKSLEGAPQECEWFDCSNCKSLKSLQGISKKINYKLTIEHNDNLIEVNLPYIENIRRIRITESDFINKINIPKLKKIEDLKFLDISNLTEINLPELEEVNFFGIKYCHNLISLNIPKLKKIHNFLNAGVNEKKLTILNGTDYKDNDKFNIAFRKQIGKINN